MGTKPYESDDAQGRDTMIDTDAILSEDRDIYDDLREDLDDSISDTVVYILSVMQASITYQCGFYRCSICEREMKVKPFNGIARETYCSIECLNESYSQ